MYFGDDSERKSHIESRIKMMRSAAEVLPMLRKALEKFDGKVYNKRFIESFDTEKDKLFLSADRRSYNDRDFVDIYAVIDRHYSNHQHVCRIELENKRICAKQAIKSASDCRTKLLQKAAELELWLEKIGDIRRYLDYLEKTRAKIVSDIPYEIADVYGIKKY